MADFKHNNLGSFFYLNVPFWSSYYYYPCLLPHSASTFTHPWQQYTFYKMFRPCTTSSKKNCVLPNLLRLVSLSIIAKAFPFMLTIMDFSLYPISVYHRLFQETGCHIYWPFCVLYQIRLSQLHFPFNFQLFCLSPYSEEIVFIWILYLIKKKWICISHQKQTFIALCRKQVGERNTRNQTLWYTKMHHKYWNTFKVIL